MRVEKWVDGFIVGVSTAVVDTLSLTDEDDVEILVKNPSIKVTGKADRATLVKELRNYRGLLPTHFKN